MKTNIEFKSELFSAYDGEEDEINPGRYGKRLAEYIHKEIQNFGVDVNDIYSEDWGWVVPVKHDEFSVWIGCGNYEEYENGFFVFVEPSKPVIRKWFRKIDTTGVVSKVKESIEKVLKANDGIVDVCWID